MNLTVKGSTGDLRPKLKKLLRELLKPVQVKSLVITKSDKYTVRGIVLTVCPIERREAGRDFEVGLAGDAEGTIVYVSVDGRSLISERTRTGAPSGRDRPSKQRATLRQKGKERR